VETKRTEVFFTAFNPTELISMNQRYPIVSLWTVPPNNHGCTGFGLSVIVLTPTLGIVLDGMSCNNCWQVGHDNPDPIFPIGTVVQLPFGYSWAEASTYVGHSHNELVDDSENPEPDSTKVSPYNLQPLGYVDDNLVQWLRNNSFVPRLYRE